MSENQVETKLLSEIKKVLLKFSKYWEDETLLRNKVAEDLREYNQELIKILLSNELIKDTYSIEVDSMIIFKVEDFISMLRYKNYWGNSYTKYTNEIGLTSEGKYLNYNTDVVLDFPHKDCILEGGMSDEDEGKNEVYYNKILAKEEIDTLFSPKILTNIKKYDEKGDHKLINFTDKDNLIIKGNNLVALHTLKKRYTEKIKLIYLDPPYNTGNDSFKYNDKFNHSTWLTFMRNRLEIANELLSSEGSIWINIDDDEAHYLKVMCDEIFGRENFITNIVWQKKYTIANDAKFFSDNHDHILVYAKNKNNYEINGLPRTLEMNERYKNPDNDPNGPWMSQPLHAKSGNDEKFSFTFKNGVTWEPPRGTFPRHTKESLEEYDSENKIWFGVNGDAVPRLKKYLSDMGDVTPATIWLHQDFGNNDQANKEVRALISTEEFSTPKPEKLIQQILKIGSNEEDIVLDFFMGSGTTQAVAHKMNRQYIGIEQMDYINTVSVPRLEKVIEGEQGGISKEVDWEGGGSFVYAELATLNDEYVQDVQASKSEEELEIVLSTMKERAYLNFKVDLEKVSLEEEGYKKLTLEEKKEVLIQVLDMNQLYLSYSEMEDEQYEILEDVKAFNHSFYQKDGEENE